MRYDQPVGSQADRNASRAWAGGWFDATGYARHTVPGYKYGWHTGVDLNLRAFKDSRADVRASADGVVVHAGPLSGWQLGVVVLQHPDGMFTRYGHLVNLKVSKGAAVMRGQLLGIIGDFDNDGPRSDHVHFDIANPSAELDQRPGYWPGKGDAALAAVLEHFQDPLPWINAHRADDVIAAEPDEAAQAVVISTAAPALANVESWTPTDPEGVRVRFAPDTTQRNIVGLIKFGEIRTGRLSADGKWVIVVVTPVQMTVDGKPLAASYSGSFDGYASARFLKRAENVVKPPPDPIIIIPSDESMVGHHPALPALPLHKRLGVHMLEAGRPKTNDYISAGCASQTNLNNVLAAREARDVGASIFRRFIDHGSLPGAEDLVLHMGLHSSDAVMVMGINEADSISTSDIPRRFAWERDFAMAVWKHLPKCFPLIGNFSMGTPQIENPQLARVWRETYGAFLNQNWQRVGLNYHNYSARPAKEFPPASEQVIGGQWLEARHLLYSYHPDFGALDKRVVIVHDESGVDIGGRGGFPSCDYTHEFFRMWLANRLGYSERYSQSYVYNMFQADWENARWAGYSVRGFLDVMREFWGGKIAAQYDLVNGLAKIARTGAGVLTTRFDAMEVGSSLSPIPEEWRPVAKIFASEAG
jgi:hypothetical protein